MNKNNKNLIPIAIIIAGILIAGVLFYVNQTKLPKEKVGVLSPEAAAEKAINYINQNFLQPGTTASSVKVEEQNGVYKFRLKIGEKEYDSYVTKDGKLLFVEAIDLEKVVPAQPETQTEKTTTTTIGNFFVSEGEICKEDGKPTVYFFGSTGCPHCKWEHPIMEKIVKKFEGYISFHNNMDSGADMDIFKKYSTGGVPTTVFGCKYYRVGSGERGGEELESKNLTALICKLTNNQPAETCARVKDLIDQIVE